MKIVKNILVPTNYSAAGQNAYQYAIMLAQKIGAEITVVHVNEYILPGAENTLTPISDLEIMRISEESMQTFVAENPAGVKVHTKILRGQAVERILAFAATEHMDLIVISASGKQHFLDNIIGSKSAQIANKAHCAVILVPQNAQWHNLDRILFASSYESMMPEMITKVIEFSKQFQAEVHLVNVNDTGSEKGKDIPEISWEQIFPVSKPNHVFEVHAIYGQDVIKALHQYAANHDIQLITFVSKHRGFWENLVHRSVSESVSLVTDKPIMIIHLDDNSGLNHER